MVARAPRVVAAGQGLQWANEGVEIFAASPAVWIGITILFMMMGVVLSIIPFAGMLWSVVVPIHAGGLMLGCRALRQGQPLEVRYLFNGFEAPRLQPLALVGALYLAASVLVMLIVMVPITLLALSGTLLSAFAVGNSGASATSLVGVGLVGVVIALVVMAAVMLLSLMVWFAPALVVFDDVPALEALKASLHAGWTNVGAFTVYGLVLLGVGLVVISPLIAAILLTVARGEQAGPVAFVAIGGTALFACLCFLPMIPAAWGAMYASYEDIFGTNT
ncbi:putative integral membrane protein [Luteitalea pratensis]|uniref:Putative integral membrane protein n=1 Tax=Luteitalea pratensis TaxID=1855912 RepID=A0A143PU93_LUTPR|nr:BPSS1780 family membrane protein [Luteitalea pratensis]AMY11374.1 putative integral membrane protein [Luteitalea pratensis]